MSRSGMGMFLRGRRLVFSVDILSFVVLLTVFFIGLWLLLNTRPIVWVDLLYDDAYYYLGVARRIVEQRQSSFLPPFMTNGYQPLWLIVLVASGLVFGVSATSLVVQMYIICFLFVLFFLYLSRKYYGVVFPAAISALAFPYVMLFGMETAMFPAFFVLFVTSTCWSGRGVFGSLLFLTRLDGIAVVMARDLYFYVQKRECDLRHYRIIVPVMLIYAAVNYALFGIPVPISGLVKTIGNIPGENFPVGFGYIRALDYAAILFSIAFLVSRMSKRQLVELRFFDEIVILLVACVMCIGYYSVNSGWPIWDWYYWAPFLLTYYALMEMVFAMQTVSMSTKAYSSAGLFMLVLFGMGLVLKPVARFVVQRAEMLPGLSGINLPEASFGRKNIELVDWINRKGVPNNSFFAMGDRAGSFGYFLGDRFRFLHTEGLVGSVGYYKAMVNNEVPSFINTLGINYWVAEREKFLETKDVVGVIEPVQALSSHLGPYVVCFFKSGIVLDQSYIAPRYGFQHGHEIRYVFDMSSKTVCPGELLTEFMGLKQKYGGIREYSLPLEYENRRYFARLVNLPW